MHAEELATGHSQATASMVVVGSAPPGAAPFGAGVAASGAAAQLLDEKTAVAASVLRVWLASVRQGSW
jgi:hypothetical protein